MRPSDEHIWRVFQAFERRRVGPRGKDDSTSAEDTARELNIPYADVQRVLVDRLTMRGGG